jgi:hypothetical protein
LKPPPVPEIPKVALSDLFTLLKSLITASVIGKTVDEPSIFIREDWAYAEVIKQKYAMNKSLFK